MEPAGSTKAALLIGAKVVVIITAVMVMVITFRWHVGPTASPAQAAKPVRDRAAARPSDDLIEAAGKGDLVRVKALLAAGADVNATDKNGSFPLLLASAQGHLDVVQALLAAGADVNAKRRPTVGAGGQTALMAAVVGGNRLSEVQAKPEVVRALLAAGADVNAKEGADTALTIASQYGSREVVQLLIAAVANQPHTGPENSGRVFYSDGKGSKTCMTTVCDPNCRMVSVPCN